MNNCGWNECIHDGKFRPILIYKPHPEMKFGWVLGLEICEFHKEDLTIENFFDAEQRKNLDDFFKSCELPTPARDDQLSLSWMSLEQYHEEYEDGEADAKFGFRNE